LAVQTVAFGRAQAFLSAFLSHLSALDLLGAAKKCASSSAASVASRTDSFAAAQIARTNVTGDATVAATEGSSTDNNSNSCKSYSEFVH